MRPALRDEVRSAPYMLMVEGAPAAWCAHKVMSMVQLRAARSVRPPGSSGEGESRNGQRTGPQLSLGMAWLKAWIRLRVTGSRKAQQSGLRQGTVWLNTAQHAWLNRAWLNQA